MCLVDESTHRSFTGGTPWIAFPPAPLLVPPVLAPALLPPALLAPPLLAPLLVLPAAPLGTGVEPSVLLLQLTAKPLTINNGNKLDRTARSDLDWVVYFI